MDQQCAGRGFDPIATGERSSVAGCLVTWATSVCLSLWWLDRGGYIHDLLSVTISLGTLGLVMTLALHSVRCRGYVLEFAPVGGQRSATTSPVGRSSC